MSAGDDDLSVIVEALKELPAKCRQAFLLRRIDEMSNAQIARVLEIPESLVHRYVVDAISHCGRRLEEAGRIEER